MAQHCLTDKAMVTGDPTNELVRDAAGTALPRLRVDRFWTSPEFVVGKGRGEGGGFPCSFGHTVGIVAISRRFSSGKASTSSLLEVSILTFDCLILPCNKHREVSR